MNFVAMQRNPHNDVVNSLVVVGLLYLYLLSCQHILKWLTINCEAFELGELLIHIRPSDHARQRYRRTHADLQPPIDGERVCDM